MIKRDLTGSVFTRWTVLHDAPSKNGATYWTCKCECGSIRDVAAKSLNNGNSPSCGCITLERCQNQGTHNCSGRTNGLKETTEYVIWSGIRKRCTNPKAQRYSRYGGRGIKVCERWNSFENFLFDMGPRPSGDHSIERKENDGDYCPENCTWSTTREQANNRANNIIVILEGVPSRLLDAAKKMGISYASAYRRVISGAWPRAAAGFTAPLPKLT